MPVRIPVRIRKDGTITATVEPEDVAVALDTVIATMTGFVGDPAIGYTGCLTPDQTEALAQRLAKMILREVA